MDKPINQDTTGSLAVAEPITSVQVKPGAIWARVSTSSQMETSLPSQVSRCKEKAKEAGYAVTHTFQADWTSLDLYSCREFQQLCSLIRNGEIQALAVLDRDRLEAKGLQRLIFLSELKEAGVELILCQGPPIIDGPEGMIVELALALGKERQVMRARQGSKDGLHDRVTKRRLPSTYHKLYGYQWDKDNNKLIPNDNWPNVKLIFDMLLDGASYGRVIQELKKRGVLSPSGMDEWNKTVLSAIAHNPSYAGQYFALKKVAVEPEKRRTNSYGNSSVKILPLDQAFYMPQIEIVNPPITWQQRDSILRQLADHQRLSQRNAKRDYLLRGMVFCETHKGKNGKPRTYHGQPHHNSWRYVCPVGGCRMPFLPGPYTEKAVLAAVATVLRIQPEDLYRQLQTDQANSKTTTQAELDELDRRFDRSLDREVQLEERFLAGEVAPEVHRRLKEKLTNERQWIQQEKADKLGKLMQLGREEAAVETLEQLRARYGLFGKELHQGQWREILEKLNVHVTIRSQETKERIVTEIAMQLEEMGKDGERYFDEAMLPYRKRRVIDVTDLSIEIGIPITPRLVKSVSTVVLRGPGHG